MAQLDRLVGCTSLSLTALTLALAGCSGNGSEGSSGVGAGTGGAAPVVGAGGTAAPGPGATTGPVTGGGVPSGPPVGAGGTRTGPLPGVGGTTGPVIGGAGAPPIGAGGTVVMPPGTGGMAPGAAGAAGNGNGTANGTANDTWNPQSNLDASGLLIKPDADKGFQIATPTFTLSPGQEVFKCYHTAFPNQGEYDVGDWESQMAKGSHHFILYKADSDFSAAGTFDSFGCAVAPTGGTWIYSAAVPHTHLSMPAGVAMPLASGQKVQFDMHYINTGSDPLQAHVTLNVNKVMGTNFQRAQSQVSFNTMINIPPNGMQTVGGDCTPAAGANYFMMLTHTHRRGIDASIKRKLANGQMGETLVHTTNWDSPENILWENPPYLTFQAGEKFHYQCVYKNDRSTNTTVGVSADANEMCMAITYFFPAGTAPPCTSDVE